jgi:hypothetical protein
MPVDTDDAFVAQPTQSELGHRAIEVVGHLLAVGIRLENRFKTVPRLRIGFFERPGSLG